MYIVVELASAVKEGDANEKILYRFCGHIRLVGDRPFYALRVQRVLADARY